MSKSDSCSMMTFLASIAGWFEKVIAVSGATPLLQQPGEIQKRLLT
jgi:hypothetical protein